MAFDSILIANRGEIAVRIMRTACFLGYRTIAVYSQADAEAPHVALADEAVEIGPPAASQSYLNINAVIEAALATGAGAVHPGYGFLAENAAFVRACTHAGLIFIGPGAEAVEIMGNKAEAKRRMIAAGVPCVPGYEGRDQSDATMFAEAERIGYPVMVKAAAGGGGRGMRLVEDEGALENALSAARSEALNAFGSDELIIERAIASPRHVEIQVIADAQGTCLYLGERDCSVQRRHQKLIEEAPCPVLSETVRARMGAAAIKAAERIGYVGAGTVEFLLDGSESFHFLEMNTRLQVEHPVTEMITGLDIVSLQIQVAAGEPLGLAQSDVALDGHAIEARLCAEDPANDFLPQAGRILRWHAPKGGGIRVDAGIAEGTEVPPFYDPMIAKIIAHAPDREAARRALVSALAETAALGIKTNAAFLIDCLEHEHFVRGEATTDFVAELLRAPPPVDDGSRAGAIAAVLCYSSELARTLERSLAVSPRLAEWASGGTPFSSFRLAAGDVEADFQVNPLGGGAYQVSVNGKNHSVADMTCDEDAVWTRIDGVRVRFLCHLAGDRVYLSVDGRGWEWRNLSGLHGRGDRAAGSNGQVTAPMHGHLLAVLVEAGATIVAGDRLAVLEAMKMQHQITSPVSGTVTSVRVSEGAQVAADDLLIEIEPEERVP